MRQLFLSVFVSLLFISCSDNEPKKLEDAFILSMQKNDFNLLKNFLPDREFYNTLSDKMPKRADEEIKKFLEESNERNKTGMAKYYFQCGG